MDLLDEPHPLRSHLCLCGLLDSPEITRQAVELEGEAGLAGSPGFHHLLGLDHLPVTCPAVGWHRVPLAKRAHHCVVHPLWHPNGSFRGHGDSKERQCLGAPQNCDPEKYRIRNILLLLHLGRWLCIGILRKS